MTITVVVIIATPRNLLETERPRREIPLRKYYWMQARHSFQLHLTIVSFNYYDKQQI